MCNQSFQSNLAKHNCVVFIFCPVLHDGQNDSILGNSHDNGQEHADIPYINVAESSRRWAIQCGINVGVNQKEND